MARQKFGIDHAVGHHINLALVVDIRDMFHIMS